MGQSNIAIDLVVEHVESGVPARSSPFDSGRSEVPIPDSVLLDSSSITAQLPLLHKHTRSKGAFLRRHYPASSVVWPTPTPRLDAALAATFGVATPSQSRASLTNPDHLLCMRLLTTPVDRIGSPLVGELRVARAGFFPCPCSLPRYRGGSASTSLLSRPAQASHPLRPAELLTRLPHHPWTPSRGFALAGFPARTLASYQVQPTTSLGGSFPHW